MDDLQEVNLSEGNHMRPTYISMNLSQEQKQQLCGMLKEFMDCFTWDYTKMPGLSRGWLNMFYLLKGVLGCSNNQHRILIQIYLIG
jgi:hypothetical protein